jgi:hypothetical protein
VKIPWDKVWDIVINKAHVVLAVLCQAAIFIMHWKFGKDISANVAQTVNWFYVFLGGHFVGSQVWPDKKDGDGGSGQG